MISGKPKSRSVTLAGDRGYDTRILCCHDALTQCHSARGAERFESTERDRWAHDPAPWLRRQPAQTQTGERSVRMDQERGAAAEYVQYLTGIATRSNPLNRAQGMIRISRSRVS
jgi:hypothetical protein